MYFPVKVKKYSALGITSGLAGAGVGALAGGLLDRRQKREGNWFKRNAGTLSGTVIGGVTGGTIGNIVHNRVKDNLSSIKSTKSALGAVKSGNIEEGFSHLPGILDVNDSDYKYAKGLLGTGATAIGAGLGAAGVAVANRASRNTQKRIQKLNPGINIK